MWHAVTPQRLLTRAGFSEVLHHPSIAARAHSCDCQMPSIRRRNCQRPATAGARHTMCLLPLSPSPPQPLATRNGVFGQTASTGFGAGRLVSDGVGELGIELTSAKLVERSSKKRRNVARVPQRMVRSVGWEFGSHAAATHPLR